MALLWAYATKGLRPNTTVSRFQSENQTDSPAAANWHGV
jgi:hypothetical protein